MYKEKDLPALPPEFNEVNEVDLDEMLNTAEDIIINQDDIERALAKVKNKSSPGLNCICYKLIKKCFDADKE